MKISELTALELGKKIKSREVSVKEAVRASFDRIREEEPRIHAYITLDEEGAYRQAGEIQKRIDKGELTTPLAGVPMAIKDNICTEGIKTTCGSKILGSFTPPYTAEAVKNLKKAGAILLGKTNMDEFAMGSTTETSFFGSTKNPWNERHVPGGSSGGSCAAVAAGECFYALGSDTGGSIRQPSSFCGVTGIKPTYGTVSRYGLIAYGSSFDQIGPIAKDTADCAAILEVLTSYDEKDSTSLERGGGDFISALTGEASGMRIGIPNDYMGEGLDTSVRQAVLDSVRMLIEQGATVEFFDFGLTEYAIPAYYVIASAEASSNLSRFDGVKYGYRTPAYEGLHEMYRKSRSEGFGTEVKRRIMLGTFVLSSGYYDEYYIKALRAKALIKQSFDRAFKRYDVIAGPVAPSTAPELGKSLSDPLKMYLGDIYTVSANLAGLPGISLPCGCDEKGLPIGLQMMAGCFEEKKLFRAASALEVARGSWKLPFMQGGTKECKAEECRLERCRLERCRLEKCRLEECRLEPRRLEEYRLEQCRLERCRLEECRLQPRRLEECRLEECRLERCRLEPRRIEMCRAEEYGIEAYSSDGSEVRDCMGRGATE